MPCLCDSTVAGLTAQRDSCTGKQMRIPLFRYLPKWRCSPEVVPRRGFREGTQKGETRLFGEYDPFRVGKSKWGLANGGRKGQLKPIPPHLTATGEEQKLPLFGPIGAFRAKPPFAKPQFGFP